MRTRAILAVTILLLAVLAGCGGDRDIEVNVYVGDQATDTPVVEPTALPAEPTSPPAAPVEPTAESAATPEPTAQEQAAAPTESAPTEAPAAPTSEPAPTEAPQPQPEEETYTFDPDDWQASVTTLSSFRQKVVLDFTADGSGVYSKATYEGEVTTAPTALHSVLRVEGEAASQLPSNQVELIWIGDQAWVKVGRRPWVQVPVSALETEYAGQVVGIGELLPFIQQARRVMPDETINGIPCKHYVYDISNLQTEAGMTAAQGDIWVAKDGGYVVRLTMNGHGTYYGAYTSSGTLNLVYDLFDVNAPISINPPR